MWTKKTSASEPPLKRRKFQMASELRADLVFGISLGDTCLLPRRCPACRWRELGPGFCSERGNLSSRNVPAFWVGREGALQAVKSREGLSTGYGAQGRTVS